MGLVAAVFVVRVVYLFWLSPWQLLGDEAYYWEWSRHLDLCYYEKGPGLAYLIAASTRLLGVSEGAVRLPMALLSAACAWGLGRLTLWCTGGNARAALAAVVMFLLLPAFQANAQICTQDGPMIACWIALSAAGYRLVMRWHRGVDGAGDWVLIALLLGLGFLFKQSILLFAPGLVVYAIIQRGRLVWRPARLLAYSVLAAVTFAVAVSPMVVWNVRHGWPTLAHTLGHLGTAGGDHNTAGEPRFDVRWPLSLVGAQVGAFGPAGILLMVLACAWAVRSRGSEPDRWATRLWLMSCALPAIGFYVALSFTKPVLGNWPFPCFVTLVVLVGELGSTELERYRSMHAGWKIAGRSDAGAVRGRKPKTLFRSCWDVVIWYGVIAWVCLSFPTLLARVPLVGKTVARGVLPKMTGHREAAQQLDAARREARAHATAGEPVVVARYYMTAALYAFYLPDHPVVMNAAAQLGKRHTAYDYWTETDLSSPSLVGRDLLLDGVGAYPWERILRFGRAEAIDGGRYTLVHDYAGVRPASERRAGGESAAREQDRSSGRDE
jgi:4-amino-4-deoxy-L-arabinose transferase-like glycosyltransferase